MSDRHAFESQPAEERFYVLLSNGRTAALSLEELDAAFQANHIDESTRVCRVGDARWLTLGELAELDEPEANDAAPALAPPSLPPNSMVPVVSDFDADDLDVDALRPKRRGVWVAAGLAAALLGAGAAVVLAADGPSSKPAPASAPGPEGAVPAALMPTPASTISVATAPVAAPSTPPSAAPSGADRFSEEMKSALLAAAPPREAKPKAPRLKPGRAPKRRASSRSRSGADDYDPLNGKL